MKSVMPIKVGCSLLVGVAAMLGATDVAYASPIVETRYDCGGALTLVVREAGETASVQLTDQIYELRRKHSSIGRKFISPTAALIIDGQSAVFVAADWLNLGQCLELSRTASAK